MLKDLQLELKELKDKKRLRDFTVSRDRSRGKVFIRGASVLDFTNWDYLDLNSRKNFRHAIQKTIETLGFGAASPRLGAGTFEVHLRCERRISEFLGQENALLFSSKNQAVLSLVTALASEQDIVIIESFTQSPVLDAAYFVNATCTSFRAREPGSLEIELKKFPRARRKFIVVQSLCPITGSVIPIAELSKIAEEYDAQILLDESYALAALGTRGAGLLENIAFDERDRITAVLGDLSLGFACYGAFVAGSSVLIEYLKNRSRTFLNEIAPPHCFAVAIEEAGNIIELDLAGRERTLLAADRLRLGLQEMGVSVEPTPSPLVLIPFASARLAREACSALNAKGLLTEVVFHGETLSERASLRFILSSNHSPQLISEALEILAQVITRV